MSEESEYKKLNREDIGKITVEELGRVKAKLGIRIIDFAEWYKETRLYNLREIINKIALCTVYAFTMIFIFSLMGDYREMFWISIVVSILWTFTFVIISQHYYLKYSTTGIDHKNAYIYFAKWINYYSIKEDGFIIN